MKFTKTKLDGVVIIEPDVFGDHRGFFMESWSQKKMEEAGDAIEELFVSQGLFEDIEGDWEEQENKNKFIALYWEAIHERLNKMFYTDMSVVCNDILFKEDYEWDNFLDAVPALAEKWYDWV